MYARKPDINYLNRIAKEVNSTNLPSIPENPNILLPPPEYSLIRNNFQIFSEELSHKLNNPNLENEFNRDDDNELNSLNNKFKTRQNMIGIKRFSEKLSLSSTFKKRRLESENNINMNNAKSIDTEDRNTLKNKNKINNEKIVKFDSDSIDQNRNKNNFQIRTDEYEEKSENQDYNENDDEEQEGDEYDQMEQNSNNSESGFDYRNHQYNNLEDDLL